MSIKCCSRQSHSYLNWCACRLLAGCKCATPDSLDISDLYIQNIGCCFRYYMLIEMVVSGTDPVTVRDRLRSALPRAPEKQFYDAVILHTSFARLLGPPTTFAEEAKDLSELQFFNMLVTKLNSKIHGFKATMTELWYVEEQHLLALALDGSMKIRSFQLGCSKA
ncbi:unnamed protein product [Cuscuta campestris]|uniref:Uncharacterized protein n=1 Tax=Cuscuta campestris TaxID=132261 RepID=A0A484KCZ9_9ASTE|nr:unnamed protein product [Cuscuta campestris]